MFHQSDSGIGGESMSILDTLITDRTQADVNRIKQIMQKGLPRMTADEYQYFIRGSLETLNDSVTDALVDADGLTIQCRDGVLPKGSYNYTDLNRVMDAVEYLTGVIRSAGYEIDDPTTITKTHEKTTTEITKWRAVNKIYNPTFGGGTNFDGWLISNPTYLTVTETAGDLEYITAETIRAYNGNTALISSGHFWELPVGAIYYIGCQYMIEEGNASTAYFYWRNATSASTSYSTLHTNELPNVQGSFQNFSMIATIASNAFRNIGLGIIGGYQAGERYHFRRPFCYNLTQIFGAGNEPDLEWCQEHLGYDAETVTGEITNTTTEEVTENRYIVQDIPTVSEMPTYLSNIQRVINRLPLVNVRYDTIPTLPTDMEGLLPAEANNIEKLLPLIVDTVERILTERLSYYSGELFGGEV